MTNTTTSRSDSRKKISVCIVFLLSILSVGAVHARAQWASPWPDSSNLPAGATQYGNVFPNGNLWDGNTLYTPANLPQRYLLWDFEDPYNGFPHMYGALDPEKATYHDANGTLIVGTDLYSLHGFGMSQLNAIPTSASDPRWNLNRNGNVQGSFGDGPWENASRAVIIGQDELVVFQIDNTGNGDPNAEKHAWISFNYCNTDTDDDSPIVFAFGAGTVVDGWYHQVSKPSVLQWGWYAFAVTITNDCDNVSFGIGNPDGENLNIDNFQIAAVSVPEPSAWGLVVLGGLALVTVPHLRHAAEHT
ncbi:MAG TPA: hypothetical protein VL486_06190 [Verrucomicrobiae bacterium]|nr:hypothetical protein [Verrucomicrobiae bacterium]